MAYVKKPEDKEVKWYTTEIMNPHGELCLAITGADGMEESHAGIQGIA
jgi:hypothetical protein